MMVRRAIKFLAGGIVALLMVGLIYYVLLCLAFNNLPFHPNPYDTLRFSRHDWLEDQSCVDGGNRRGHMADDIVRHHLHLGMTEVQVVALLGPPDHSYTRVEVQRYLNDYKQAKVSDGEFQPQDAAATKVNDYYLGEELSMGAGVDRAGLYLYMDSLGRYQGCRIHAL